MRFKVEIITDFMNEHNLSEVEMAEKCGIKLCCLKRILKSDLRIRIDYFVKIAELIGCRLEDFREK